LHEPAAIHPRRSTPLRHMEAGDYRETKKLEILRNADASTVIAALKTASLVMPNQAIAG
jgi:hypothetical protein